MQKRLLRHLLYATVALFCCQWVYADDVTTPVAPKPATNSKFISIADIHFNPFSGCVVSEKPCVLLTKLRNTDYHEWDSVFKKYGEKKISPIGQDTNYPLLKTTLTELQSVNEQVQPRFVLVLGDFLAHEFHEQYAAYSHDNSDADFQAFVKKTLLFLTYRIRQTFPDLNIFPAIGNNDSYTGDYAVDTNGKFFAETAETWSDFILDNDARAEFSSEFPLDGYYAVNVPGNDSQRIIMLNTIVFSTRVKGHQIRKAAQQELTWLNQQLINADKHKQHVLLAFHIPIGIDVYATLKNKFKAITEYWEPRYSQSFEKIVKHHASSIVGILPAHIHMDTFQLITVNRIDNINVIFTPAISPIFGNNPGFKVFSYDPDTFKLKTFESYYYPVGEVENAQWQKELSLNQISEPKKTKDEESVYS